MNKRELIRFSVTAVEWTVRTMNRIQIRVQIPDQMMIDRPHVVCCRSADAGAGRVVDQVLSVVSTSSTFCGRS